MARTSLWHLIVPGFAAFMAVVLWFVVGDAQPRLTFGIVALSGLVIGWFTIGRHGWHSRPAANAFIIILIVVSGLACAAETPMAIIQCIAYPLVWVLSPSTRWAVVNNAAVALSVAIGFYFGLAEGIAGIPETLTTVVLSFAFSMAVGYWIVSISVQNNQRRELLETLEATREQLAAAHHDAGVQQERERLAREIHDTVAQDLTGIVLLTQRASRELTSGELDAAGARLQQIEHGARQALTDARTLVASTAAGLDGDIGSALTRLGERYTRESEIVVTVTVAGGLHLDRTAEVVLLRCAQESLANVRKHAAASEASIVLRQVDHSVELTVRDDGRGFIDAGLGFGHAGMRDRLALMGGELSVVSAEREGTTVTALLPLTPTAIPPLAAAPRSLP